MKKEKALNKDKTLNNDTAAEEENSRKKKKSAKKNKTAETDTESLTAAESEQPRKKEKAVWIWRAGIILAVLGAVLLLVRTFVQEYGTGDPSQAYLARGVYADVSDDLSYAVINDSNDTVYYIDFAKQAVKYILKASDLPVVNASIDYVCLDSEDNLYLTVVQKDDRNRGNLSERIVSYDKEGNFLQTYLVSNEEGKNGYLKVYGLKADGGWLHYIRIYDGYYAIQKTEIGQGTEEIVAEFTLAGNREVLNASYDNGDFIVNFSDGTAVCAGADGKETELANFNFRLNDAGEENVYADMFVHGDDGYYFLDKKYSDAICRMSDGQIERVYTLSGLYGWDENWEQTDYVGYHKKVADDSIYMLDKHGDNLLFTSNANLFVAREGTLERLYASEEGLRLPDSYIVCNVFRIYSPYLALGLVALGVILCVCYVVRYRFTVLNKTILFMIPFIIIAFLLITKFVVDHVENIYRKDAQSKLMAVSSLLASSLDTELLQELNDLEDVTNGNAALIREQLKRAVEDGADWDKNIDISLYAFDDSMCHYILAAYPQEKFEYLNTYYFQDYADLKSMLAGDSNIAYTDTRNQKAVSMDAITLIYSGEKPVAMLDAYMYLERMNEDIREIQFSIILIAVIFTGIVIVILVLIVRYISKKLAYTSGVIKEISNGNLDARAEKLPKDEIGRIGQDVNDMAVQIKQRFDDQTEFSMQVIECLVGTIDAKDKYTNGHSLRVAQYASAIAKRLGKSEEEQRQIYYCGLLHDIGKIGVPDTIINKTSKLTDAEYGTIKTHPEIGYEILSKLSKLENISIGAHSHHERIDGKGYPQGLKGDDIPEIARIIGVADTYDAMTSIRSYRGKLPQESVRKELERAKGTQLDEQFAQIMLELDEEMYPEGY